MDEDESAAEFDAMLTAMRERTVRLREGTAQMIETMEAKLAAIDSQNRRIAELLERGRG